MKISLPFRNQNYIFSSAYLFFFFAAWSIWWSFYAIWLKNNLGISGTDLGTIYSINQFTSITFMILYGVIQDKLGIRKHLMWIISLVLIATGPFLIYVYEPLLNSNFMIGVILGSILFSLGYLSACGLIDSFVEKISRKFGFEYGQARLWGCIGYALAAAIGGIFFSINPHLNFWSVSVIGILFFMTNCLYHPAKAVNRKTVQQKTDRYNAITLNDFIIIFKNPKFWSLVVFTLGTWSFYNIYDQQLFPVFFSRLFSDPDIGVRVYGQLNSVQVILEGIGMACIPLLINRIGPKHALLLGGIIMTCRIMGSAIFSDIYIISFIKMLHAIEVPLFVISIFKYNAVNFDKRLSATLFLVGFQIATSIGIIILSIPIGMLFDRIGYHQIFFVIACIVIISIIAGLFTLSNKKLAS
ncbi:oligosaccharide MFS transporter [Utexia brackfieldae]|uniref:oligosaccharide MFS transporter n=1 Tax=Utexia brackfieldae TaxID=3074108 RepID=UPI00370DA81B